MQFTTERTPSTNNFSLGCDQLKDLKEVAKRNVIKTSSVEKTVKKKKKQKKQANMYNTKSK